MNDHVTRIIADMSHLMWQAKVHHLSAFEVRQRFRQLQRQHLSEVREQDRGAVSDELSLWSGRINQLFNPAFLEQAI